VVPSPNPSSDDAFHSVTGRGANDIWAAGTQYLSASNQTGVLVEHWDGRAWRAVPAPVVKHDDYVQHLRGRAGRRVADR
jgi:hypothetical protein